MTILVIPTNLCISIATEDQIRFVANTINSTSIIYSLYEQEDFLFIKMLIFD